MGHKVHHTPEGGRSPTHHDLPDEPLDSTGEIHGDLGHRHFSHLDWPLYVPIARPPVVLLETAPYRQVLMIAAVVAGVAALLGLVFSLLQTGLNSLSIFRPGR
jgi:hypothetical protein